MKRKTYRFAIKILSNNGFRAKIWNNHWHMKYKGCGQMNLLVYNRKVACNGVLVRSVNCLHSRVWNMSGEEEGYKGKEENLVCRSQYFLLYRGKKSQPWVDRRKFRSFTPHTQFSQWPSPACFLIQSKSFCTTTITLHLFITVKAFYFVMGNLPS